MNDLSSDNPAAETVPAADREPYWQEHLARWQQSGLSKIAYCRQENLSIHQLKYWCRKLRPNARVKRKSSRRAFVPLRVATPASTESLTLTLPNGMRVGGISEQNLAVVKQLVEQL